MTTTAPVVPEFGAFTIVGNVLLPNEPGEVYHTTVMHTTLPNEVAVVFVIKPAR